jgi:tetratricopeptide (TPR) repeat protein
MQKPSVFVSYSHCDHEWKDRLVHHLQIFEREERLDVWNDDKISAGANWLTEIEIAIARARIAILLISVDFLRSPFIRYKEFLALLARHRDKGLHIFPIIVRSCAWDQVAEIASIQARPLYGKALAGFRGDRRERELTAIAREILHLAGETPTPPDTGSVSRAAAPSRNSIPAAPADFVGRKDDLDALRRSIGKGARICGIRGQGGVGKTALALVLAHGLSADYSDAQIYLDMQGMSERPLSPSDAMSSIIRTLVPDAAPGDGPELAAAYSETLKGKHALLLMDNVSGPGQVESLLPPAGSLLLLTSRQRFALPGLAYRDLDLLATDDARALLLEIEPRIDGRADEIARLCGLLPLALRIAASTLVERPDLSVSGYVDRLKTEKTRVKLGELALGLGYSLLPDRLQQCYRQLAIFIGDFDRSAAGAVWMLDEEETEETLGVFIRGSLLDGAEGRYKLHDLARAFAAAHSTHEERSLAQSRHAEHYCRVLEQAGALYMSGHEHVLAGVALFDQERYQIAAGQAWAIVNLHDAGQAARLASEYPHAAPFVLSLRLSPRQRIRWLEDGVAGARLTGDRMQETRHIGNLGTAYAALGNPQRAIDLYEEALRVGREIGDRRHDAIVLGNLGVEYQRLQNTSRAIELYEQQLIAAREIGDRRIEEIALGNLGVAHKVLGDIPKAIQFYEQALAVDREIGDREGEATDLSNLGSAHVVLGNTDQAIEFFEQAIRIDREIGDRQGEAIARWNLGEIYEKAGDLASAITHMQVLVDLEQELGHPDAAMDAQRVEEIRISLVRNQAEEKT